MDPANDDLPYQGTPGIIGGPRAPPRLVPAGYGGLLAIRIATALVMVVIAWVLSEVG